ncbi:MAG: metallophosphoesterase [Muribaculaceae bacterium]|nr:metallophosphoesterase [Muribaculaceae bacterium]
MRIQILPAIILLLLSVLTDAYIISDIRRLCARAIRNTVTWIYSLISLACYVLVIIMLAWPKKDPTEPILTPMWLLFIYLSVYIPKIVYAFLSLIGRIFLRQKPAQSKWDLIVGMTMALILFVSLWSGTIYTRNIIEVNNVDVYSDRLPESFDGLRILQFSDLHAGTWGNDTTFVSELVDSINAQQADLVVFTGDFVNRVANELEPFVPVLSRIKAPMGVYGVLGNHDYGGYAEWPDSTGIPKNVNRLKDLIRKTGMKLLCNETTMLRNDKDSLALIGVENWGEPPFNQLGDLVKAYAPDSVPSVALNDTVFKVLLTHNPNHWDQVVREISNVDLSMAGHTHAMQAMFEVAGHRWSPASWKYPQWGGLYESQCKKGQPMYLYVNIGAGEVGYPARIGVARPEINVITLRRNKEE